MTDRTDLITVAFLEQGRADHPACDQCPTDDDLTGFFDQVLDATTTRAIEEHALRCAHSHELLGVLAAVRAEAARANSQPGLHIRARLVERGLELLNAVDLTLRGLTGQPALGAVRGGEKAELVRVAGPGDGLDEIELQAQSDGSVRFVVSGELSRLARDDRTSVVLEVDGVLREKRPYSGERVAFAPLTTGACRITVLRRRPGGPATEISEARVDLCA